MRRMKPTSMLIALVMMLMFTIGGSYLITKPMSETYRETKKIEEKWIK